MIIQINGTDIKVPNKKDGFRIGQFELSKGGRTADGTMTKDIIAKKHKFFFEYAIISAADLKVILDIIYNGTAAFFTLTVEDYDGTTDYTVYVGEINRIFFRRGGLNGWYYTDFAFNLIEQ